MNKIKRVVFFAAILLCTLLFGCEEKTKYTGNGIVYLDDNNKVAELSVYNWSNSEKYSEKLGSTKNFFWMLSDIYEDESVAILNDDIIYVLRESEITSYSNKAERIVGVKKISEGYVIISQYEEEYKFILFDNEFNEIKYEEIFPGIYNNLYLEDEKVYFSSYVKSEEKSYINCFNVDRKSTMEIFSMDYCATILPYCENSTVYALIQKRILDEGMGSEVINELVRVLDKTSYEEIMNFSDNVKKILHTKNNLYLLLGENTTSVLAIDLTENTFEQIVNIQDEASEGLYYIDKKLMLITSGGVYDVAQKTNKIMYIDSGLVNQYQ